MMTEQEDKQDQVTDGFAHYFGRIYKSIKSQEALKALDLLRVGASVPEVLKNSKSDIPSLSDVDLYSIIDAKQDYDELERHREHLLREIKAKDKLDAGLETQIKRTFSLSALEDIYLPFKLKGRTTATIAKKAGLGPMADWLWDLGHQENAQESPTPTEKAKEFINDDYKDEAAVLLGVQNILVERIAETAELRATVRQSIMRKSKVRSQKGPKAKAKSKYVRFFDYREPIGSLKKSGGGLRYLLMRKGWAANELVLSFDRADEGIILEQFEKVACSTGSGPAKEILMKAARLALNSNVFTAIEHEAHKRIKEQSEDYLIGVLINGLKERLLAAPFGAKSVLSIDAGIEKKACSLALIDDSGSVLAHSTFPVKEDSDWDKIRESVASDLEKISISAVVIAHGPKGKMIRKQMSEVLKEKSIDCPVIMVYDQASSIYSNSSFAKEELPDMDPAVRRAIFTGRLVQDPLMELAKVDPRFLATAAFPFDINPKKLGRALHRTISGCLAKVGVPLNKAHRLSLSYLPGFDHTIAKAILAERNKRKSFSNVEELKQIAEVTEEAFKQAHHFLYVEKAPEDPRAPYKVLKQEAKFDSIKTVKPDVQITGVATNITSFGVFVDIGLDQDGLIHVSEFNANSNPIELLNVGSPITAWTVKADLEKNQISLALTPASERKRRRPPSKEKKVAAKPVRAKLSPEEIKKREDERSKRAEDLKKNQEERTAAFEKKAKDREFETKRKARRDPKTGAIVTGDDSVYTSDRPKRGGPRGGRGGGKKPQRFATNAKATTFNPFANLDSLIKDKSDTSKQEK